MNPLAFLLNPVLGGAMSGDGRPNNTPGDMEALQRMLRQTRERNGTPNGRVARGFDQFGPQPAPPSPIGGPATAFDGSTTPSSGVLSSQNLLAPPQAQPVMAQAPEAAPMAPRVPMPPPRPQEAPQSPEPMGFFQRNTAMMQDPLTGTFLDPAAAQQAQASGPDVIHKLLQMFNKDKA